jgi:hypothetical protein
VQGAELLLEEPQRDLLGHGDLASRDEPGIATRRELDHRAHRVLEFLRDLEHAGNLRNRG